MHRAIIISLIATLGAAGAGSAQSLDANKGRQIVSIRVSTQGLDLTSEAGAEAFLKRLGSAADRACGGQPAPGVAQLSQSKHREACRLRAMGASVAKLDHPNVSRLHAASPGGQTIIAGH
jgi:UrcA family protein